MSMKSPIFPVTEPRHFSDYGFDSQFDYFQVPLLNPFPSLPPIRSDSISKSLQILEEAKKHKKDAKPIDSLHLKLQKPISKDSAKKRRSSSSSWWKKPLLFLKWRRTDPCDKAAAEAFDHRERRRNVGSMSGPVYYVAETVGPCRSSGPVMRGEGFEMPYFSLRELNVDRPIADAASSPIYLVT
ncbi:hypothetical protein QJS04_geneDACA007188 [Acorus gramineus]|uniref:Uncharacterized protein n=1 Tax=Acorus gramineus TaxID=55184 RepID=A0AAV9BLY8_ACOGR|nr:hypothetical protein QJS04_geneDACA007188 [Acorus gramineus]